MTILFLCQGDCLCKEQQGYVRAFARQGARLAFVPNGFPANGDLDQLLRRCCETPFLIVHPELQPVLPVGLADVSIPTVCFQIDTYAYTRHRIAWSKLFDYSVLFHPGFEDRFRNAGHPAPLTFAHAVQAERFLGPEKQRIFEIGWVGRVEGPMYEARRRVLPILGKYFRMNRWKQAYAEEEVAEVYRQSEVVVNIGRDDYPQDANLRVFEAMAAGALLITSLPSELTQLGFREGTHFLGYRHESELVGLVRQHLGNQAFLRRLAESGREEVLREHTYDCRVKALVERVKQDGGRLIAPARNWKRERISMHYLDYYSAHSNLDCAYAELRRIGRGHALASAMGRCLIARALTRNWKRRLFHSYLENLKRLTKPLRTGA